MVRPPSDVQRSIYSRGRTRTCQRAVRPSGRFSMNTAPAAPPGPDLVRGIAIDEVPDGHTLLGHVGDDAVLMIRRGDALFAIGATCSHYGGPLAEGLVVGDTVRCPWHHACFDIRTGEALRAPALSPVGCWAVERRDGKVFVSDKKETRKPAR